MDNSTVLRIWIGLAVLVVIGFITVGGLLYMGSGSQDQTTRVKFTESVQNGNPVVKVSLLKHPPDEQVEVIVDNENGRETETMISPSQLGKSKTSVIIGDKVQLSEGDVIRIVDIEQGSGTIITYKVTGKDGRSVTKSSSG